MAVTFSVIMPVDRPGEDANRAIAAVLAQTLVDFELLVVAGSPLSLPDDRRITLITESSRNPALRRNRAADVARGEILAFIDDDAFADREWLVRARDHFSANGDLLALGGADPAPPDSPPSQLISELLLATPFIGSGIAAHEARPRGFNLTSPHHIALVNLFVRREAFEAAGRFDESIGYIGEDTALVERLIFRGRVRYEPDVIVYHRRRSFPVAYLSQRWRYRLKTGKMLASRGRYRKSVMIYALLAAGFLFLTTLIVSPRAAMLLLLLYSVVVYLLSLRTRRIPLVIKLLSPLFFLAHHGCYFFGLVAGIVVGTRDRFSGRTS